MLPKEKLRKRFIFLRKKKYFFVKKDFFRPLIKMLGIKNKINPVVPFVRSDSLFLSILKIHETNHGIGRIHK